MAATSNTSGLRQVNDYLTDLAGKPFGLRDLYRLLQHDPELRAALATSAKRVEPARRLPANPAQNFRTGETYAR